MRTFCFGAPRSPSLFITAVLLMISSSRCQAFVAQSTACPPSRNTHCINNLVSIHRQKYGALQTLKATNIRTLTTTITTLQQSASSDDSDSDPSASDDDAKKAAKLVKATKAMTAFTNKYLQNTDTKLCQDAGVAAVVIQGLAEHKVEFGAPLCPCRFYEDKQAEVKDGYWNCPCVPMRERHECHCMLFLTEDNAFAGDRQEIDFEEVQQLNAKVEK